jgi:hypothetical protein
MDVIDLRDCSESVVLKWEKNKLQLLWILGTMQIHKMEQRVKRNGLLCMVTTKLFEIILQGLNTTRMVGKCLPR